MTLIDRPMSVAMLQWGMVGVNSMPTVLSTSLTWGMMRKLKRTEQCLIFIPKNRCSDHSNINIAISINYKYLLAKEGLALKLCLLIKIIFIISLFSRPVNKEQSGEVLQ